jgi:GNAT superfamily N-acetyltransferase
VETAVTYLIAKTAADFETGRALFQEYAQSLKVDLCFQNFSTELETITEQYNLPGGGLYLALYERTPAGCAGVRKLDEETAELKRMFVKDEYRGHKIGVKLLQLAIDLAKQLGYTKLRLDTLEDMVKAQQLYRSFGFYEIPAYRYNPLGGTIYMEKML